MRRLWESWGGCPGLGSGSRVGCWAGVCGRTPFPTWPGAQNSCACSLLRGTREHQEEERSKHLTPGGSPSTRISSPEWHLRRMGAGLGKCSPIGEASPLAPPFRALDVCCRCCFCSWRCCCCCCCCCWVCCALPAEPLERKAKAEERKAHTSSQHLSCRSFPPTMYCIRPTPSARGLPLPRFACWEGGPPVYPPTLRRRGSNEAKALRQASPPLGRRSATTFV